MTTQRQIESNRLDAGNHATEPRTLEGKEVSKRNALKHVLAGMGVVLPEDESQVVADRAAHWRDEFRPETPFKVWLAGQAARESVRIERCFVQETVLLSRLAFCARFCWDEDRRLAAETLVGGISRRPEFVSRKLRQSAQGCDLLLERWRGLVQVLDVNGGWNEKQVTMALDLLGIPVELRNETTLLTLAPEADPVEAARAVALAEIADLEALRAGVLDDLDGVEQGFAELGLGIDDNPALKQLRRHKADCKRWFHWALGQLVTDPGPIEAVAEAPAPVVEPVAIAPPPSPEPESPSQPAPSPAPRPAVVAASSVPKPLFLGMSLTEALIPSPESGNRRTRRARRRMAKKG